MKPKTDHPAALTYWPIACGPLAACGVVLAVLFLYDVFVVIERGL